MRIMVVQKRQDRALLNHRITRCSNLCRINQSQHKECDPYDNKSQTNSKHSSRQMIDLVTWIPVGKIKEKY